MSRLTVEVVFSTLDDGEDLQVTVAALRNRVVGDLPATLSVSEETVGEEACQLSIRDGLNLLIGEESANDSTLAVGAIHGDLILEQVMPPLA